MPIALRFQWYAWYLFAYDSEKADYRTFKVARMQYVIKTNRAFSPYSNSEIEKLLKQNDEAYFAECECIEVLCKNESICVLEEYFPTEHIEKIEGGNYKLTLHVPPKERLWQALLLSIGDKVKIISPKCYKLRLIELAQGFLKNNDKQLS